MLPLETPVLSLAIDAVSKVEGEGALCGLLTLFSKCKEGLQDGPRLENMAWRLWHVGRSERLPSHLDFPTSPACSSPGRAASPITSSSSSDSLQSSEWLSDGETWDQDQATAVHEGSGGSKQLLSPLSSSSQLPMPMTPSHGRHPLRRRKTSERSQSPASTASREPSLNRRPSLSSRRTHSNTSVGKIMADLLPEKLDVYSAKKATSPGIPTEREHWRESGTTLGNVDDVPSVIVMPDSQHPQPPSPTLMPAPILPNLEPPRFPTVVIVNPTPHPTPPMTPHASPQPTPSQSSISDANIPLRNSLCVPSRTTIRAPLTPPASDDGQTSPISPPANSESPRPPAPAPEPVPALAPPLSSALEPKSCMLSGASSGLTAHAIGSAHGSAAKGLSANTTISNGTGIGNGSANGIRLGAELGAGLSRPPVPQSFGMALNPPEHRDRKFFMMGSPDGDSPDTSASSQVGSHSATTSANAGEPGSVASRTSITSQAKSHSSAGSSGGLRMKSRKGKGKEVRLGSARPGAQRSQSKHRLNLDPNGGTIQRSKIHGRTAAAIQAYLPSINHAPASGIAMALGVAKPAAPAPLRPQAQPVQQPAAGPSTSKQGNLKSPVESSPRARRPSPSRSSSSKKASIGAAVKPGVNPTSSSRNGAPPVTTVKQHRIEIADDSDYSTDEEWDTEGCSEDAERTSGTEEDNAKVTREADRKLAEAAAEAQRQRALFAKVPQRSYSNLNRTQSGLLSTIFHPNPELFPPNHPYRQTRSTQDILAHTNRPLYQSNLVQTKSAAAVPVAATVNAQGVGSPNNSRRSPLRLQPRPEMEMEESDSGEDEENKVPISESVAEQRLAALHKPSRQPAAQPSNERQQQQHPQQRPQRQNSFPNPQTSNSRYTAPGGGVSQLATVATAPIPLGYPYNLPLQMPPSTPRTTRRNMLTHELSESLRRNLLWERQVSKQRPMGLGAARRPAPAAANGGAPNQPLRPLTSMVPAAQPNGNGNAAPPVAPNGAGGRLARNRSWADEYHGAGW